MNTALILLMVAIGFGCNNTEIKTEQTPAKSNAQTADSLAIKNQPVQDSIIPGAPQDIMPAGSPEDDRLQPIRENFKRINAITKWTKTAKRDIPGYAEGAEATYFFTGNAPEKIVLHGFNEMSQNLTEFYLFNGQLSFVFEKTSRYNRPFNYDSAAMKENNDVEAFDIKKSKVEELRSYFENGRLFHQVKDNKTVAPNESEQDRIHELYVTILREVK